VGVGGAVVIGSMYS